MADLTQGYRGNGGGNTRVVQAILDYRPLSVRMSGDMLAHELFVRNFMPFAKSHWNYDGTLTNCEHLARALHATWDYVRFKRHAIAGLPDLPRASVEDCGRFINGGIITKPRRVFQGPARGNVRVDGDLDGRCLFPCHYICHIGVSYFDPTFDYSPLDPRDIVQRRLQRLRPGFWLSDDEKYLYLRNEDPAPAFSDSWDEINAEHRVTYQEWITATARTGHWRSGDLAAVDRALQAYENRTGKLEALQGAFVKWFNANPKEVAHRDRGHSIYRLAQNLKLARRLLML